MMRKAVPRPACPNTAAARQDREEWEREIDNYDRSERRRNKKYRERVIRLNHMVVALISTDRKLPLSRLNDLEPVDESTGFRRSGQAEPKKTEGTGNVAFPISTY